jgi:hypothetical protein
MTRRIELFATALVVLNLLDAVFTLIYTRTGLATESNPVMQGFLAHSPVAFMAAKLTLVSLCVALLLRLRHRTAAVVAMASAATMYALVFAYHLSAVPRLVASLQS